MCSTCRTPRFCRERQYYKRCQRCGSTDPSFIAIQESKGRYTYHQRTRKHRSVYVLSKIKEIFPNLDGAGVRKLLHDIIPKRDTSPNEDNKWYVQAFHQEPRLRGKLPYDPCTTWIPRDVRAYMKETTMMQVRVPTELHKWFKRYATEHETTMTRVIINYLESLRVRTRKNFEIEQV